MLVEEGKEIISFKAAEQYHVPWKMINDSRHEHETDSRVVMCPGGRAKVTYWTTKMRRGGSRALTNIFCQGRFMLMSNVKRLKRLPSR